MWSRGKFNLKIMKNKLEQRDELKWLTVFCTALVIADSMPRDPDEGEEGIFSEELWSRESSASNKRKKAGYCIISTLQVTNYSKLVSVTKILKFCKLN